MNPSSLAGKGARPAAFLDRDGVINIDGGYTFRPADLRFTSTAVAAIRRLNDAGWWVIVVTNQSGVARGLFGTADVEAFHAHMADRLAAEGARIDAFYYCPFHPDGSVPAFSRAHEDRKPGPGMVQRAMRDRPIDAERSVLIGDKASDMEAAAAAGIHGVQVVANEGCDLLATVEALLAPATEDASSPA
jgi:D-glycero-D-manno-heptose 1,7-bisphosphate phosphatase